MRYDVAVGLPAPMKTGFGLVLTIIQVVGMVVLFGCIVTQQTGWLSTILVLVTGVALSWNLGRVHRWQQRTEATTSLDS